MENEGNSKSVQRNLGWDWASAAGASKVKSLLRCQAMEKGAEVCIAFPLPPTRASELGPSHRGLDLRDSQDTPYLPTHPPQLAPASRAGEIW